MASGLLGKAALVSNTDTTLYTVPAATVTTATINFCNTTSSPINARLAVTSGGAASLADYLEYEVVIPGNGVLERTGLVLSPGDVIIVRASAAGIAAQARGFEEPL